ncbi:DUF3592 domain-containing protein [Candidatus Hydrogenedentota bacterium]
MLEVITFVVVALVARKRRARKEGRESEKPLATESYEWEKKERPTALAWLFCIAIYVGLIYLNLCFPAPQALAWMLYRQHLFAATPCEIVSSEVEAPRKASLRYSYEYGGKEYTGNVYKPFHFEPPYQEEIKEIVENYPPGLQTVCYVNTHNPSDAVLRTNLSQQCALAFIFTGALFVGFMSLVESLWKAFRDRKRQNVRRAAELAGLQMPLWCEKGRWTKLAWTFVFNFFGNGFVLSWTILGVIAYRNGEDSGLGWELMSIVLLIVGFGWGFRLLVKQVLSMFNPIPALALNPGILRLGEGAELTWELRGRASLVSNLTITADCIRNPSVKKEEEQTVDRVPILETAAPSEMSGGKTPFTIPRHARHTHTGKGEKHVWRLRIHGDIRRWPDLDEEFPIIVIQGEDGDV